MKKIMHVAFSNKACVEGFITDDPRDADWTATGKPKRIAVPSIGEHLREWADSPRAKLPRKWALVFDTEDDAHAARVILAARQGAAMTAPMIRADAPELLALVEAGSDVIRASNTLMLMLAGEMSMTKPSLETAIRLALDARNSWDNALAAWEAIAPKTTADALTPWGIQPDGSGLDPATLPIHRGGKASDNA